MSKKTSPFLNHDPLGYYQILGLSPKAGENDIKQSYRELAKIWHPDHNTDAGALDKFQQLAVAYDTLKDEHKRITYDLLSCAYNKANFPDISTLKIYNSQSGNNDINLRAVNLWKVTGKIWKYNSEVHKEVCTYKEALRLEFFTSLHNWLLGWWNPTSFAKNLQALTYNFLNLKSRQDNLTLLIHNALAYALENKPVPAAQSALLAQNYADDHAKYLLQKFITNLNISRLPRANKWNYTLLRLVQLFLPLLILILGLLPLTTKFVTEADIMKYFSTSKEISYYQEVRFTNQGRSVDDVVVGKILSIPVDRNDASKLYHLKKEAQVMYGPDDDFDVLKTLPTNTTVRITGITPDNTWYRVMIDNGDMGFVRFPMLIKGIGLPVPEYSKIYEK